MNKKPEHGLDKVIHERARLLIMTKLSSSDEPKVSFNELKSSLEMTAGNLSVQLANLETAGYVSIEKQFVDKKSSTCVSITMEGHQAFLSYLDAMEHLIRSIKETKE